MPIFNKKLRYRNGKGQNFGKGVWIDADGDIIKPGQGRFNRDTNRVLQYNTDGSISSFTKGQWVDKVIKRREIEILQNDRKYAIPASGKKVDITLDKDIEDKHGLRTSGVDMNVLDSIAVNAKRANLPFSHALGLVAKESSFGKGVDKYGTGRGYGQSFLPWLHEIASDRNLKSISYDGVQSPTLLVSDWQHYESPYAPLMYDGNLKRLSTEEKRQRLDDVENWFIPALRRDNRRRVTDKSPLQHAFEKFRDTPDNYNHNDHGYAKDVRDIGEALTKHSPEIRQYMKDHNIKADGGFVRKKWDDMTMREKAAMMKVAVDNGLYRLDDIRKAYNEFAEGGDTDEPQISDSQYYSIMEGVVRDNWRKWGDTSEDAAFERVLNDNSYDYRGYYANNPQGQANADTHWPDTYKTYWHPTFSTDSKYSGNASQFNPTGATGGHWIGEIYFPADAYHQAERFGRRFDKGGDTLLVDMSKVGLGAETNPSYFVDNTGNPLEEVVVTGRDRSKGVFDDYIVDSSRSSHRLETEINAYNRLREHSEIDPITGAKRAIPLESVHPEFDMVLSGPLVRAAGEWAVNKAGQTVAGLVNKYPILEQAPRYAIGKFKYGFDAELPTLYRKLDNVVPDVDRRGMMSFTRTPSRFEYVSTGEDPKITNFTTDVPVRDHSWSWASNNVFAVNGKTLLGKRVVSTRPSDTFVIGSEVKVPSKKVTFISGRPTLLEEARNKRYKTVTSRELQNEAEFEDFGFKTHGVKDPKYYYQDYARMLEQKTRELFKKPTLKDYQFMDYVFNPQFDSQVMPLQPLSELNSFTYLETAPQWVSEIMSNDTKRRVVPKLDNLFYDPMTYAEHEYRFQNGIDLIK